MVTISQLTWKIDDKSIESIYGMNRHLFPSLNQFRQFLLTPMEPFRTEVVLYLNADIYGDTYDDNTDYYIYDNLNGICPLDIMGAIYTYYNSSLNPAEHQRLIEMNPYFEHRVLHERIDALREQIWLLAAYPWKNGYEVRFAELY